MLEAGIKASLEYVVEEEYSDEEEEADEQAASTENSYYNAKMVRDDGKLEEAADLFLEIVSNEEDNKTAWGFKSLKQLIKLYSRMEKKTEMIKEYVKLLGYIVEGAVTQNVSEKGIKSILERESTTGDNGTLHKIYSETLKVFKAGGGTANERLWFKTNLKLGQLLLDMSALDKLETTISEVCACFCVFLYKTVSKNANITTKTTTTTATGGPCWETGGSYVGNILFADTAVQPKARQQKAERALQQGNGRERQRPAPEDARIDLRVRGKDAHE